jgi:hypothetical protein
VRPGLLAACTAALAVLLAGCGSSIRSDTAALPRSLVLQARPVGRGARFQSPVSGPVVGACRPRLGARYGSHIELFAENRVVIVPAGIGTLPPRKTLSGRITSARCYSELATLEPTGLVLVRAGSRPTVADLFHGWGQPLSPVRLGPFDAPRGTRVRVFVDGRPWRAAPGAVPLRPHAVIVLEVGPYVPPHVSYRFPPGT